MASELMLIKSKMMLPHEEGTENDPRREIADALALYQQAKLAVNTLRPMYEEYSGRYIKGTDDVPPEKGLPLNMDTALITKALSAILRRMKIANATRNPTELVNPLIKHKVVSVEEKIEEMCIVLEEVGEATLYDLLVVSENRAELVARFMGILELIKLHRIVITNFTMVEDVIEYEDTGIKMSFKLNPDYVAIEGAQSEFDAPSNEENNNGGKS
jgi:segregation and condensation protein A